MITEKHIKRNQEFGFDTDNDFIKFIDIFLNNKLKTKYIQYIDYKIEGEDITITFFKDDLDYTAHFFKVKEIQQFKNIMDRRKKLEIIKSKIS